MMARTLVRLGLAAASALGVLLAGTLPAQAKTLVGHGTTTYDDRQVVQLTETGTQRGRGGLELHLTGKDHVVASNLALATTSCDGCHATAISFQVVVADRAPSGVEAGNAAIADNSGCAACEADAFAYQFVLVFDGNARITGAGRHQLDQIDAALARLARAGGSAEDTQVALDAYATQVVTVLSNELRVRPVLKKVATTRGHAPAV